VCPQDPQYSTLVVTCDVSVGTEHSDENCRRPQVGLVLLRFSVRAHSLGDVWIQILSVDASNNTVLLLRFICFLLLHTCFRVRSVIRILPRGWTRGVKKKKENDCYTGEQ
jgi:hypothetical protein